MNIEIRAQRLQLCLPPQAAGSNPGPGRQFFNAVEFPGTENISRIFPGGNGNDFEICRNFRGKVFQAVHCKVYTLVEQRFLDFLGEHALGADLGKGDISDAVAGRLDDLNLNLMSTRFEQRLDVRSLPQRQLRSPGADS